MSILKHKNSLLKILLNLGLISQNKYYEDNKESHRVLREYYEKYQKDGFVNAEEEQIMMRTIRQFAIDFKNKIIR